MSRNASGTFTLPAGNPVVTGTIIDATWANDTMSDLGNSLTNSLARDGKGGMLASLLGLDGTLSNPAYAFTNAPSTGLYRAGAGDMRMSVVGVDVFRLTAGSAALWDVTDSVWYPLVTSKTNGNILETVDLIAAQTVVPFTANVAGASIFVNGTSGDRGRLLEGFDYTYNAVDNEIILTVAFPATTKLTASYKDETAINIIASSVGYDDSTSGLGGNVQLAIDTLDGKVDDLTPLPSWAVLTASDTLTAGQRVFADTSGGGFTITLPASPSVNATVEIADYSGTFFTSPVIINRNGEPLMGLAENMNLNSNNLSVTLTYIDATQGWRIT
jgi:hypothetical protein